jgi:anti-anti-sigma factor
MPFVIKTRNVGTATILELGARLTAAEGSELKKTVDGLLAEGRTAILLDCVRMGFIDSQGIAALVRTWVSVGRGSKLKLFSLTPHVKEVLDITGLLKVMNTFEDVGAALQSLSQDS